MGVSKFYVNILTKEEKLRFLYGTWLDWGVWDSRVSSRVGSVSYGHIVVLVSRAPDPVESPVSSGERGREPALQDDVFAFHNIFHFVFNLTAESWN